MQQNESGERRHVRRREDLAGRVSDLEMVLGGDMVSETKGIVQIVKDLAQDMYGPKGLSPRVANLEEFKLRGEERAKGAIWATRIFWGILSTSFGAAIGFALKTWIK